MARTESAADAVAETTDQQTSPAADPPESNSKPKPVHNTAATDWRDGIGDEKLREFAARFTAPADLAKTALEFRQKLSNAVILPGKDASEEEVAEFHGRLGVPRSPDGYRIELPDDLPDGLVPTDEDEARINSFFQAMHKAGATPATVQTAIDWYYEGLQVAVARANAEVAQAKQASEAALRKEWGGDYDRNLEVAKRAVAEFGGQEFAEFLDGSVVGGVAVGDRPEFVRAFAAIGLRMGESGIHLGMDGGAQPAAEEQLKDLTSQIHDALDRGHSDRVRSLSLKRDALAERLYGAGPVVGSEGRTT